MGRATGAAAFMQATMGDIMITSRYARILMAGLSLSTLASSLAFAETDGTAETNRALLKKLDAMERRIQTLGLAQPLVWDLPREPRMRGKWETGRPRRVSNGYEIVHRTPSDDGSVDRWRIRKERP